MNTDPKNALTIVRVLNAPREKVWRACREPAALEQWWGLPHGATMPVCTVDFRVGGALHFKVTHPGFGEIWFKCLYREIVEGTRLVMEQYFSDANGSELDTPERPVSTITLGFEDLDGKTRLTVRHAGMASAVYRVEQFQAGWGESLDRLTACLARP